MGSATHQTVAFARIRRGWWTAIAAVERRLEVERDQLALWLPVAVGGGIAAWFVLPDAWGWAAFLLLVAAIAMAGRCLPGTRLGLALTAGGLAAGLGCALVWASAERAAAPVLRRPVVASLLVRVDQVQPLAARDAVRVVATPIGAPAMPFRLRLTIAQADAPARLAAGDRLRLRARLVPPQAAPVPGAYDFARVAWFQRIGATGRAFAPVERVGLGAEGPGLRERLSGHIRAQLSGGEGAIAAALATGDQGAMPDPDAEAMRRSGLAHLLSVSGLHITAVVGFAMVLVLRLLALSPRLALRWPLLLIAAGAGAVAGIGYTLLTGAEVPTIRSCVAALLVLTALAIGRDALTLRLVAAGALIVLLLWPESLVGASFQLSFAAVTALIAFHERPAIKAFLARREEGGVARCGRILLGALLTGLVVELALAPIALFHFHRAGLYGALANIVAIPLTTFVIMPLEALALLFDVGGMGAPLWWAAGKALALLLWIAHTVAVAPGAVAMLPTMARGTFALMIGGGLWMVLWKSRLAWWGAIPLAAGTAIALATPVPDLLVTGDGRHAAVRDGGTVGLLRPRAGGYIRDLLAESAGLDGVPGLIDDLQGARCGPDACIAELVRGGRRWRIMATRSGYFLPFEPLVRACATVDIAISERRLPAACRPRWLKIDRTFLGKNGGVAITLATGRVETVAALAGAHPWARR
ncbi:ComEC/Rec2 family competence protein [Sphingomonas flavalba]|uniref:ComEC/Rec2 family competence protein n=1 Tax=Sphingomonas flavalba TaxID=2559804 RepID=UPI0039E19C07